MTRALQELFHLLAMDDQLWSDFACQESQRICASFTAVDWEDFERCKESIAADRRVLLGDLVEILPAQRAVDILVWVLLSGRGSEWVDIAARLGEWLLSDPQLLEPHRARLCTPAAVALFEMQVCSYINRPVPGTAMFTDYLESYSHMLGRGVLALYAHLRA